MAREYVLENIRQGISHNRNRLIQRIAAFEVETGIRLSLAHFVEYHGLELDEIYRRDCWTNLCVKAGILAQFSEPDTDRLVKGLRRLQHVTGVHQIRTLIEILGTEAERIRSLRRERSAFSADATFLLVGSGLVARHDCRKLRTWDPVFLRHLSSCPSWQNKTRETVDAATVRE